MRPQEGRRGYDAVVFTAADFELYTPRFQGDTEWNGRRLEIRHRLQRFGDTLKARYQRHKIGLDRRESLHHPHHTNHKRVRRQRTMLFRDKKARKSLQGFLGRELGKDLDSAMNNVHLQVGLDGKEVYWGLRIDRGAWYDLNVLLKRTEEEAGRSAVVQACQAAPGFTLLVDQKGPRPLHEMDSRDWRDLAGILRPGESSLEICQSLPAAKVVEAGSDLEDGILGDLERLKNFFSLSSWTLDGSSPSGASL